MITIKNQTERVIVVESGLFSIDIPIAQTVTIEKECLSEDGRVFCRYFSNRGEETSVDYGVRESGMLGQKKLTVYYDNESSFPMVTSFLVKDGQNIVLKEWFVTLFPHLFKTVRLRKLTRASNKFSDKEEYLFQEAKSKKLFLRRMRMSVFLLPLAAVLSLAGILGLFDSSFTVAQKVSTLLVCAALSWLIYDGAYYYFAARKWKTKDEGVLNEDQKHT